MGDDQDVKPCWNGGGRGDWVPCGGGTVACEVVVDVAELDCEAPVWSGRLPLSLVLVPP